MKTPLLSDLRARLVIAAGEILLLGILVVLSHKLIPGFALACLTTGIAGIGVWEFANLVEAKGIKPSRQRMLWCALPLTFSFYVSHFKWGHLPLFLFFFIGLVLFVARFRKPADVIRCLSTEGFGILYVVLPIASMLALLFPPITSLFFEDGRWWIAFLLFTAKGGDTAAYFVGRLWGKRKLAPVLSPSKTWEGAIAAFMTSLVLSLLFYFFTPLMYSMNLFEAIFLGAAMGVLSQVGDLAESLMKRDADVKDSNSLPGVGGILDTLDSLTFAAPFLTLFLFARG